MLMCATDSQLMIYKSSSQQCMPTDGQVGKLWFQKGIFLE